MQILRRSTLIALGSILLGSQTAFAEIPIAPPRRPVPELQLPTHRIPLSFFVGGLRSVLDGIELRLHNWDWRGGRGGVAHNASYMQLGPALGGRRLVFDIPSIHVDNYYYYINNINLRSASAAAAPGQGVRLVFQFESKGTELRGHCRGSFTHCPFGPDDTAPDVHIDHARVEIVLTPAVHPTGLTLQPVNADFNASIRGRGVLALFNSYKVYIRRGVQSASSNLFRHPEVQNAFARNLRPILDLGGVGTVRGVRVVGETVEVIHVPRR